MPSRILVIHTDEQHHRHLGRFRELPLRTPHLDRLARRGTTFGRAYAAAGVCVPSRASLMTGRYSVGHGTINNQVTLPLGEPTMGSCFRQTDLATGYFGKEHYGRDKENPHEEGWDVFFGRPDYNRYLRDQQVPVAGWPEGSQIEPFPMRYWTVGKSRIPPEHYFEPVVTDQAIDFLRARREESFLCFVSLMAPHAPFTPPGAYASMYEPAKMPLTPRTGNELNGQSPQARQWVHQNQKYLNDKELRIWTAATFGLLTLVDDCVGRLLGELEQLGLREDTLVIFTSDHGDFATRYGIIGKSWMMSDDLLRIPLIIDDPQATRGGDQPALVQNIDLLPTMLDYAGARVPPRMHGRSLLPMLRGRTQSLGRPAFAHDEAEYTGGQSFMSMIVDGPWKYVHQSQGWRELYHLEDDPGECRNLAADPAQATVLADLREKLLDWHVADAGRSFDPDTARFWEDETCFYDENRFTGERLIRRGDAPT